MVSGIDENRNKIIFTASWLVELDCSTSSESSNLCMLDEVNTTSQILAAASLPSDMRLK